MASIERVGRLRLFTSVIRGVLGSKTQVELSAAGECDVGPERIAVIVRDVSHRLTRASSDLSLRTLIGDYAEHLGKAPLRTVLDQTVALVERHYIDAALRLTDGNRTAAAQLLGLSRQSLHTKLHRYGLDQPPGATPAAQPAEQPAEQRAPRSNAN